MTAPGPEVARWMKAQADATAAILDKLPGRVALLARMREIEGAAGGLTSSISRTAGGRYFFLRRNPGENQFKLVWREGAEGKDRVIFDPAAGAGDQPRAVMDFSPSADGRKLAYSVQTGGGEIGTLHVVDVASGRELIEPIDRIRYAYASWLEDGSGFFYSRLREGYEKLPPAQKFGDRTVHLRLLPGARPARAGKADAGSDRPLFSSSRVPALGLPPFASGHLFQLPGTRWVAAMVFYGVEPNRALFVSDLASVMKGETNWKPVVTREDLVRDIAVGGDWIYMKSGKEAPRYQVLRVPVNQPEMARAERVVPQSEATIAGIAAARDGLYLTRREGVLTRLHRLPHAAPAAEARRGAPPPLAQIALPQDGGVDLKSANPKADGVVIALTAWTHAQQTYRYDPRKRRVDMLPLAASGASDAPQDIEAHEVTVKSHDGTLVPLSIVARKGAPRDGSSPTILYGYGAYGSTEDPFFSPRIYAWLQSGGIWATAHVRGGGVYGKAWHEAGRKTTKPNTWKDAIAAAEWLIANNWTRPDKLAIYGGSAGGIFVGRAITERPDLFAAAVPAVGTMDALRFETSANGVANIPEFGTVKDEAEFKALLAMSSYHHVRDGVAYPAVMAVHGVNDIRVDVWQSTKFTSRLATATTSGRPVLLRLEYDSGHGQGSTRAQAQQRSADIWCFLLWQFGVPDFQPVGKYAK